LKALLREGEVPPQILFLAARIAASSSRKAVSFSSAHNETLSVAAMRVSNPDRSPLESRAET